MRLLGPPIARSRLLGPRSVGIRLPVVARPSVTMFASGTPFAFYNGAIATAPATDPDAVVREVLAFFAGKGYGAAVTWAVVAEGARRGYTHAVLQTSESGYPVYRRVGFVDGGWHVELAGPPAA